MIGDLFSTIDGVARVIGWCAIIGFILWLVGRQLEDTRLAKEAEADRRAMWKFEEFLKQDNPDKYNRYENLKRRYQLDGDHVHWHSIAQECGVPIIEIIKSRP